MCLSLEKTSDQLSVRERMDMADALIKFTFQVIDLRRRVDSQNRMGYSPYCEEAFKYIQAVQTALANGCTEEARMLLSIGTALYEATEDLIKRKVLG